MLNDISTIKDFSFFNRTMFLFEHNRYVNSIFVNEITDKEFSDFSRSINIIFDTPTASITIDDITSDGIYLSTEISTFTNKITKINNFFLLVDEEIPVGADILYYIIGVDGHKFPITPNRNTPTILPKDEEPSSFKIRIEFKNNGISKAKVNSIAVMYHDYDVDMMLGLKEPDLSIYKGGVINE